MGLMDDQLVSFALAAVSILLLMTVAFRSFRIRLISLVPNICPIVLVIGSMGLTVDSSIPYLTGYLRARRRGLDPHAALRETSQGVGLPLVFANGALVSAAMLGGLIGNLILLPLPLRWSER